MMQAGSKLRRKVFGGQQRGGDLRVSATEISQQGRRGSILKEGSFAT